MKSAVLYYRVSTKRQNCSGLGLDAQRTSVENFLRYNTYCVEAEYTEVESGKKNHRPMLIKALQDCKKYGAVLLIAKLDRLSRNVAFISSLMESDVEFKAVDNPHADKLLIHIIAAFAEHEREQISRRTVAALKAARARGVQLGSYGKHVLSKKNKQEAEKFAATLKPVIDELHNAGITSIRKITIELNKRKIRTSTGGRWHISTVHTLLKRIKEHKNESNEF